MATVTAALPAVSGDLSLYQTTDPLLSNAPLLLYYGPAATVGATSSRVQLHIFTTAGHASYPRLAISPNSPFYTAVSNLPREEQGDEVCRAIAFGLRKYFAELSNAVKEVLCASVKATTLQLLFGDNHVAILASRLKRVENAKAVTGNLVRCFAEQKISWLNIDVVLPPGTIKEPPKHTDPAASDELNDRKALLHQYGKYADIIASFGDTAFLPTSKLRRAPSKVSSIGRTASFMRQQRENARKEVLELISTEASYVSRLREIQQIRDALPTLSDSTKDPSLRDVFSASLDSIVDANSTFLAMLQRIELDTADSSRKELDTMASEQPTAQQIRQDLLADNQGIGAIARCLCDVLPQFAQPYAAYTRDHASAILLLRNLTRGTDVHVQAAIQHIGEQKLTSLLIEPVQRLPRYSLYIDSISKQLPARHPALKFLLKARDLVTSVCEQSGTVDDESISDKLCARVSDWPSDLQLAGRLVSVVDYVELQPPYELSTSVVQRGILLLLTSGIVTLAKKGNSAISAKALATDLETVVPGHTSSTDLAFIECVPLNEFECTECHEGQSIRLILLDNMTQAPHQQAQCMLTLLLEGSYEGKASRLVEEITKARTEARFSETERESHQWDVRCSESTPEQLRLFSAVLEDSSSEYVGQRNGTAAVRVIVDIDKHSRKARAGQDGTHTIATISLMRDGSYRLSIDSVDGQGCSEQVSLEELAMTLRRKLASVLSMRVSSDRPAWAIVYTDYYRDALSSITVDIAGEEGQVLSTVQQPVKPHRGLSRPLSPVKMLSNFLSSTGPGSQPPALLKKSSGSNIMAAGAAYNIAPASRSNTSIAKPPSRDGRSASKDQPRPKSSTSMQSFGTDISTSRKLEDTLSAYVLALEARKGNIVGRSLKMRSSADELATNELYNVLLENNQMMVSAAQASVDVLFAAFEKFLHVAWCDQLGPIIPTTILHDIQVKAETLFPADFDKHFRDVLHSFSPPNQRAFKTIINLLNQLLDGTGNDADRGALTAAFAELLVTEGDANDYVALFDRFVGSVETYFGEPVTEQSPLEDLAVHGHKRSRSVNTGSLTSNTSSLRRKFGLGLSRENSKSEHEKGSVWRTLSKSRNRDASPADGLAGSTSQQTRSIDSGSRPSSRPVSQDGPQKTRVDSNTLQIPTIMPTILPGLTTIGEHPSFLPTGPPRKKRRSSLSDLKMLDTPFVTPQRPQRSTPRQQVAEKSLPASPIPSTPSSKGGSLRLQSPARSTQRPQLPAAFLKENSPGLSAALNKARQSPAQPQIVLESGAQIPSPSKASERDILDQQSHVVIQSDGRTASPTKARPGSGIPALSQRTASPTKLPVTPVRSGLSERHDAGNVIRTPSDARAMHAPVKPLTGSPSKKLCMQSPQKIRERLQAEQAAVVAASSDLQDELSKISDELTMTPSRLVSSRSGVTGSLHKTHGTDLAARVLKLESTATEQISSLTAKLESIQADVSTSLAVSENKCKKLDELYRESNAENEALYARFNTELARISRVVKSGDGVEELKRRLKEQEDEVARLKKENVRLKREALGLRAQLKE